MEFLASHFGTIVGLLAGFGTIGIVVLVAVVGMPAAVIIANVVGFFKAALAFLKTPVGQVVGILLLCAACLFAGDLNGTRREAAKCRAAAEQATIAAERREAEAQRIAAEDAARIAEELTTLNNDLQGKVTAYEAELSKRGPDAHCVLGADDVKRLRDIVR